MSRPMRIVAALYKEHVDAKGNITLEKLTTTQWLTVSYIANTMGVSEQTMYRLIVDEQVIPHTRVGFQIRVATEDFLAYQEKCKSAEYERPGAK